MNYYIGQENGYNWFSVDRGPFQTREELKAAILLRINECSGEDSGILLNTKIATSEKFGKNIKISDCRLHSLADAKDEQVRQAFGSATAGLFDEADEDAALLALAEAEAEADLRAMG